MYVGSNCCGPGGASQTVDRIGAGGFQALVSGQRCHAGDLDPPAASSVRLVFRCPQPIDGFPGGFGIHLFWGLEGNEFGSQGYNLGVFG